MTGSDAERELATWFHERGFASLRAPGSGSIGRPSPDVVALTLTEYGSQLPPKTESYAIELKANSDGTAHFDEHEVTELEEWADRAGATAFVVIKPDLRTFDHWLCFHTSELNTTDSGYSVRQQDHDKAKTRSEVFL